MDIATFDQMLNATLDDQRLTRNERQALARVIADEAPNAQQLAHYRSRAFDLARQQMGRRDNLIEWLEEITKVLTPVAPAGPIESHAYFTPGDDCAGRILVLLAQARRNIDICVFTITHDQIASGILAGHERGIDIRIITDEDKSRDAGSDVRQLIRAGVKVRLEQSDHHMHHKFAIFDDATLLNGSYNWTRSAALYNQENITLTNDPSLIKDFRRECERLWAQFV